MEAKSKILLADDHVLVAEGLQKLLESDYELTGIAADGRSLLKAVQDNPPDVAVVDISLPLLNGLDASRQILKLHPAVKIIILTMHAESTFVTEAFRIGVAGYVLKQSVGSELVLAIQEVLKGNRYISPVVAQVLDGQAPHPSTPGVSHEAVGFSQDLSIRQREVLQLVAEGKSMKEVAAAPVSVDGTSCCDGLLTWPLIPACFSIEAVGGISWCSLAPSCPVDNCVPGLLAQTLLVFFVTRSVMF